MTMLTTRRGITRGMSRKRLLHHVFPGATRTVCGYVVLRVVDRRPEWYVDCDRCARFLR